MPRQIEIRSGDGESVSALVYAAQAKKKAAVTVLLAHGAGANQWIESMI